ncbi:histidine kinase [Haloarcula nitratireducens]|uniref:Histidine kinase n=1 Tax=Haloarcula nitratireducens TaxID=2487749 RepID=A0AAW4PBG2_9EURY|nr:histidine kinase [Halomicroarcula nitratireducens]MBX0295224.1 histidine kinase [Halomicroarcula nitratireducens]
MATESTTAAETDVTLADWQAGVLGGILGAAVMAVLISLTSPPVLQGAIPGLYGLSGGVAGWVVHLSHGAVLGVAFAAVAERGLPADRSIGSTLGLGVVWGVVTWLVLAALVMPLWLGAVGFPQAPPFPNFAVPSLLWHVVYGGVLGITYAALR